MKPLTLFALLVTVLSFSSCVKEESSGAFISYYISPAPSDDIVMIKLYGFELSIQTKELEEKPFYKIISKTDLSLSPQEEESEIHLGDIELPEGLLNAHQLCFKPNIMMSMINGDTYIYDASEFFITPDELFPPFEITMKSMEQYKITLQLNLQNSGSFDEDGFYIHSPLFNSKVEKLK